MTDRRVLLLDVMGTLVVDPFYEHVPRFFGTTLQELVATKDPQAWPTFERGEIDEAELFARFFVDRRRFDGPGLKRAMAAAYAFLPGVEALLVELRAAGVEMHALSNYSMWHTLIEDKLQLSRFLSWTFVSCKTGLRKPDPCAYRHAIAALGVAPAQALLVDDRADNCAGARAEGLGALRFEDADGLRAELRRGGWLHVRAASAECG